MSYVKRCASPRTLLWLSIALGTLCSVSAGGQILLPVEVEGASATTVQVPVEIPAGGAPVSALWMRVNGVEYSGQMSVRVNSGAWTPISNQTASTDALSASWGGIGGPIATQTLVVPLPAGAAIAGSNSVAFRFNGTDGASSGFRVLAFNFERSDGTLAVPSSTFVQDDPSTWVAPLPDATDIAAGYKLWHSASLVMSPLQGAPAISAHCADCHAADGRDLKYFNYSNHSIEARAQFHGLSAYQGEQIASYIRSLNVPDPGRPWNPPYQPGPGIDQQPVQDWSAGAGLDAILPDDSAMLAYLFPQGISLQATSPSGYLNVRETPIALPLPDWNQWLPRIHPMDFWGPAFTQSAYAAAYPAIVQRLQSAVANGKLNGYLRNWQGNSPLLHDLYEWNSGTGLQFYLANVANIKSWTPAISEGVYATGQWELVKTWEMMQEFGLENKGSVIYGTGPATEQFTWPSQAPFHTSPHAAHIPEVAGEALRNSPLSEHYFADAWYQLQLIIDPGNGRLAGAYPIDWSYAYGVMVHTAAMTGSGQGARFLEYMMKGSQESYAGGAPAPLAQGWNPNYIDRPDALADNYRGALWAGVASATQQDVELNMMENWLLVTKLYSPQQYYAAGLASPLEKVTLSSGVPTSSNRMIDKVARFLYVMSRQGVSLPALSSVAAWARTVWPSEAFFQSAHWAPAS